MALIALAVAIRTIDIHMTQRICSVSVRFISVPNNDYMASTEQTSVPTK
jgi:hypothetical protein